MKRLFLVLLFMTLVTACSDGDDKPIGDTHVWKSQTDVLEKAKNVEQLIQDSTAKRLKAARE